MQKAYHWRIFTPANNQTIWPLQWWIIAPAFSRQTLFAGYVLATAKAMGIDLRWGGDWNRDTEVRDNSFDDLVHFEIVE
jgi:peptidoglycan LD-endopeptidase CwlK